MKKDVAKMSLDEIERELRDFEWEYIALSDKAQTDEYYAEHAAKLDERKKELLAKLSREKKGGLTPDQADEVSTCDATYHDHLLQYPENNFCDICGCSLRRLS